MKGENVTATVTVRVTFGFTAQSDEPQYEAIPLALRNIEQEVVQGGEGLLPGMEIELLTSEPA